MQIRRALQNFAKTVAEEAERNPEFEARVRDALGLTDTRRLRGRPRTVKAGSSMVAKARPRHRRTPAVLDPVELARENEAVLHARLSSLTVEQLKDIVADCGMDTGKLVMKWKSPERIIDRIIEVSLARARKGDAFRS